MDLVYQPTLSTRKLFFLVSGMFGVQFCWALKTTYMTPLFLESYDIAVSEIGLVRVAGPLSGLVVQPLVGVLADVWQKRAVFFKVGIVLMVLGMVLVVYAGHLALALGLSAEGFGLGLAIVALWALDLGMNGCLLSLKLMAFTKCPRKQHPQAMGALAAAGGAGQLLGFLVGGCNFSRLLGTETNNITILFMCAPIVLLLSLFMALSSFGFKERNGSYSLQPFASTRLEVATLRKVFQLPGWLRQVCGITFCCWVGWYTMILLGSDWMGEDVFGGQSEAPEGSPERQRYDEGLRWSSLGSALQSAIVFGLGLGPVSFIVERVGFKAAFAMNSASQAFLLFSTVFFQFGIQKRLTILLIACLGFPWAMIQSLPYMVIGIASQKDHEGELLGKLNVFIVLAELFVGFVVSPIILTLADDGYSRLLILIFGACFTSLGLILLPSMDLEPTLNERLPAPSDDPALLQEIETERVDWGFISNLDDDDDKQGDKAINLCT